MEIVLIILGVIGIASILCVYIDLEKYIKKHENKEIDKPFYNICKQKTIILCGCIIFLGIVQIILILLR